MEETDKLVHKIEGSNNVPTSKTKQGIVLGIVLLLIIGAGIFSGYLLSGRIGGGISQMAPGAKLEGKEVGSTDEKTFKDTATGVLEKGGIDGEGTHKLIREGGPSQTAYLTSSIIDLDQFAGKKVQVWGETFSGQKAGWLMDVGRVKILE
jgi:hypothetical protein